MEIIKELKNKKTSFNQLSPKTLDAMRGTMWLEKWRGSLTEFCQTYGQEVVIQKTIDRLFYKKIEMKKIKLDARELKNTKGALGTYRWKYDTKIIDLAVALGMAIDTAPTYGYGKVTTGIMKASIKKDRGGVLLTKIPRHQGSYKAVMSLGERIKTQLPNWTRILQLHWPLSSSFDSMLSANWLDTMGTLQGVGLCNCSWDLVKEYGKLVNLCCLQNRYNIRERGLDKYLAPKIQKAGGVVFGYSPFGQNLEKLLTYDKNKIIKKLTKKYDATPAQILLGHIIKKGIKPIFQTNNKEHLKENVDAFHLIISNDDIIAMEESFDELL